MAVTSFAPFAGLPAVASAKAGRTPHSAFSLPRFSLPFWQSGADGRMEQGRWEGRKRARGRIITSARVGGKKRVQKRQLGPNSDQKREKSRKKRPIRPYPS